MSDIIQTLIVTVIVAWATWRVWRRYVPQRWRTKTPAVQGACGMCGGCQGAPACPPSVDAKPVHLHSKL